MKSLIFVAVLAQLGITLAIEPIVIVHGGAGSVAANRVDSTLSLIVPFIILSCFKDSRKISGH